jgi:hypothetical protein
MSATGELRVIIITAKACTTVVPTDHSTTLEVMVQSEGAGIGQSHYQYGSSRCVVNILLTAGLVQPQQTSGNRDTLIVDAAVSASEVDSEQHPAQYHEDEGSNPSVIVGCVPIIEFGNRPG